MEFKSRTWKWIGHTLRKPDVSIKARQRSGRTLRQEKEGASGSDLEAFSFGRTSDIHVGVTWTAVKKTAQNRIRWRR